ncbi:MAG: hypothetical protein H6604_02735 [Flavobacteriales bacterium]|nr:hypothetical protein [Flavobacteriales bacterium]
MKTNYLLEMFYEGLSNSTFGQASSMGIGVYSPMRNVRATKTSVNENIKFNDSNFFSRFKFELKLS